MASERDSILVRPLGGITAIVVRHPLRVIGVSLLFAIASLGWAAVRLEFKSRRLDLLNPANDDAIVVVRGLNRHDVAAAMDQIVAELDSTPDLFRDALCRVDRRRLEDKGLYFLTLDELRAADQFVSRMEPILFGRWETISGPRQLRRFNQALRQPIRLPTEDSDEAAELIRFGQRIVDSLEAALRDKPRFLTTWPKEAFPTNAGGSDYLVTNEGELGFVLVKLAADSGVAGGHPVDLLRKRLRRLSQDHPRVRIGLTGLPILEHDEMQASQRDTLQASVLSLVGVAILFSIGFGAVRYPMLAIIALANGLAWCMAFITMTVGHLNILSVAFGAILIGLGIDFGIHYVARYMQLREQCGASAEAIVQTARSVGPGIVTGGVTTAIAFLTASASEFTGVVELGWIAGGGVLLCVVSALILLPALLHFRDRDRRAMTAAPLLPLGRWARSATLAPRRVLLCGAAVIALLATGLPKLAYDHNLLHLQPKNLPAVQWERVLLEETDRSVWFALSINDTAEELKARKAAFASLPTVDRTEEIVSLLPTVTDEQQQLVRKMHLRLTDLPENAPVIPLADPNVEIVLLEELNSALQRLPPGSQSLAQSINSLRARVNELPARIVRQRLFEHQQQLATDVLKRLRDIGRHSNPQPPQITDLSPKLVSRYVGRRKKHLLKIYAAGDVWNIHSLQAFVKDLEQVDPRITGHPVQTFYASSQMQQSYIHAACYAIIAVAFILMLDFRSFSRTLLAMIPMGVGLVGLFGVLGWLSIPLNAANMIVLPLIVGIGIDDGVHVVHDWIRQPGRYQLGNSTATAIVITSATTMIGFGSLMLAQHQGLRSLGQVLTLGVATCMLASLLLLPAVLSLIPRSRR